MIDSNKYNRTVPLHCPTCGGTEYEQDSQAIDENSSQIKCLSCGLKSTKSDLIAANQENISAQLDEIKADVLNDITNSLKSTFKGNKFIKFK